MENIEVSDRRDSQIVYIGIGSNLGDSRSNCEKAIEKIGLLLDFKLIKVSGFYLTEPVGSKGQEWYVNAVAAADTLMPAHDLMRNLLKIESDMGRIRKERWESRIIDLDLLIYGDEVIDDELLIVPHPMMHKRRFVMIPMVEIAPDLIHIVFGKKMSELLDMIPEEEQAVKYIKDR